MTAKTQQSSLNTINIFANKFFEYIWKENKMLINVFEGILIPFVGTTLGATCVFCMKKTLSKSVQRALAGFAAGIMVAASIWSLLIPAIKQSENMKTLSFIPAVVGFWIGILFLLALDHLIPHLHPEFAGMPLAVGGDPEARHGIVLTANYIAKQKGVKTGMALWQAKQICPEIIFVPPRMDLYLRFSQMARHR